MLTYKEINIDIYSRIILQILNKREVKKMKLFLENNFVN